MDSNLQNPNDIGFCKVHSEAKRIVKSQKRHFYTLSLLFLFPLSLFTVLFLAYEKPLIVSFLFTLFAIVFSFCSVATITHSSFHVYNGQPIDVFSSISSVFPLFFPFLSTFSLLLIIVSIIFTCLGLFLVLIYKGIQLMGFGMNLNSFYFVISYVLLMIVVGLYLDMSWILSNVIALVEGKRCYGPLRRSAYLVKDLKGVILSLQLFTIAPVGLWLWYCSTFLPMHAVDGRSNWLDWLNFAVLLVYFSGFLALWLLHSMVRNVVLYVHCKALRGELLDVLPI